jgi:signal transduction histidine kinase/DNA-binding NarL/FixJ family response regulator
MGGVLTIGIFITLAVYHLFIFIGQRKNYSNLAFALFCITYSLIVFLNSIYPKQAKASNYLYQIFYTYASVIFALVFIFFGHTVFKLQAIIKVLRLYYIVSTYGTSTVLGYVFFKKLFFVQITYFVFFILLLIFVICTVRYLIFKKNLKNQKEKIIFVGYLVLSVIIIFYTIQRTLAIEPNPVVIRTFFLFMALLFVYAQANDFNKEHAELAELTDKLERKVQERTRELNEAKMQKETFFISIAHELKTPLTIILHQFQQYEKKHESTEELSHIRTCLDKLRRNIVYFLDINKLEKGLVHYDHSQIVEIKKFLKDKVNYFKALASCKKIQIILNADNENIYIRIDTFAIDDIINNLLENAIKYNTLHGKVYVTVSSTYDKTDISISDTGIGITQETLPHIFEPYFQGAHTKHNIHGMGMGLAITKEIMDTLGAQINVSSNPKEGTSFTLHFNRYYPTLDEIVSISNIHNEIQSEPIPYFSHHALPEPIFTPGNKTIFLIEDNPELLTLLIHSLNPLYNIYYALNGKEALKKMISGDKPDLIISDVIMDEMDGFQLREELSMQKELAIIPFIFLTAKTSRNDKLTGLGKGAVDYICKPFEMDELLLKISSLIKIISAPLEENLNRIHSKLNTHLALIRNDNNKKNKLSSQEIKVISMLNEGLLYKEIACKMNISIGTVQTYIKRIYKKLSIHCVQDLLHILH